jgi:predicted GH43/DUF377 family glycosyl hydrolase
MSRNFLAFDQHPGSSNFEIRHPEYLDHSPRTPSVSCSRSCLRFSTRLSSLGRQGNMAPPESHEGIYFILEAFEDSFGLVRRDIKCHPLMTLSVLVSISLTILGPLY